MKNCGDYSIDEDIDVAVLERQSYIYSKVYLKRKMERVKIFLEVRRNWKEGVSFT